MEILFWIFIIVGMSASFYLFWYSIFSIFDESDFQYMNGYDEE